MSYQPYQNEPRGNLVPSGIQFFGDPKAGDQMHEASTNFVYNSGLDQLLVGNIILSDSSNKGYIGSQSCPQLLKLNTDCTAEFASGVTIQGDLTVNGTQFISNTETVVVRDNIILLNSGVTGLPTENAGLEVERGTKCNVQLLWDETDHYWKFTNTHDQDEGECSGVFHPIPIARNGLVYGDPAADEEMYIDINPGCGISVANDKVQVALESDGAIKCSGDTGGLYLDLCPNKGLSISSSNCLEILDGSGLLTDSTGLHVGQGNGVTVGANDISVNVGSGLFVNTDNSVTIKEGEAIAFDDQGNLRVYFDKEALVSTTIDTDELLVDRGGDLVRMTKETFVSDLKKTIETLAVSKGSSYAYKDITLANAPSATNIEFILPPAADYEGKVLTFKRLDAEPASTVKILSSGAQTIDNASYKKLYYQYESLNVVSDSSNWFII